MSREPEGSGKLAELEARLAKLADRVRAELPERAQALREAERELGASETEARAKLTRLAHMIRGTAGSHGMPELTEPAARVETLAPTLPIGELREAVRALADAVDRTAREKPASSPLAPASAAPTTSAAPAKPLEGRAALAIDDDGPTRKLLQMTLANIGGATARVAERPGDFFDALADRAFDVVIVDAMMPEMNGLACLEHIAGSPLAHAGTRYFVLSAASPEELGWTLPGSLEIGWLRKPFRPRELLDAIGGALAR